MADSHDSRDGAAASTGAVVPLDVAASVDTQAAGGGGERRLVALVLPELLCELATAKELPGEASQRLPLAVVLCGEGEGARAIEPTTPIAQLNLVARRLGLRPGQSLVEARAFASTLRVVALREAEVTQALARVAELALAFGTTACIVTPRDGGSAERQAASSSTVWLDISGAAHLFGGEQCLCEELSSRVRALGHRVRIAVAAGPLLAQAFAYWLTPRAEGEVVFVIADGETRSTLEALPLQALPLETEARLWLNRVGIFRIGELNRLPRKAVSARLGAAASRVFEFCAGRDPTPLIAYEPPARLCERLSWDEPLSGLEPLLFVLRRLTARLSARLEGRGLAAQQLELRLHFDRSVARLQGHPAVSRLHFELTAPLWRDGELVRVLRARLERVTLVAPLVAVELVAPRLTSATRVQLSLARGAARIGSDPGRGPELLPVLLAELGADVGTERLGWLELGDSHRPELQSRLSQRVPASLSPHMQARRRGKRKQASPAVSPGAPAWMSRALEVRRFPTRLLTPPLLVGALRVGGSFVLGHELVTVEKLSFDARLGDVEWWSASRSCSRDYLRLWLRGVESGMEASAFIERDSGRTFLQALYD